MYHQASGVPCGFLSTLPVRGATERWQAKADRAMISIHAPREGSDRRGSVKSTVKGSISIHAPREGSD